MSKRDAEQSTRFMILRIVLASLLCLLVPSPKDVHAAQACTQQTLSEYLTPGFACEFALGTWQFSQFSFDPWGHHPSVPTTDWSRSILVTPFGGTQRAGLQFELLAPLNAVGPSDEVHFWLDVTVQRLSASGITSAALSVPEGFYAGPPDGLVWIQEEVCVGTLIVGYECAPGWYVLDEARWGDGTTLSVGPANFTQAYLIDTHTYLGLIGDLNGPLDLPGGARIDGFSMAFNVVPAPSTLGLLIIGLVLAGSAVRLLRV